MSFNDISPEEIQKFKEGKILNRYFEQRNGIQSKFRTIMKDIRLWGNEVSYFNQGTEIDKALYEITGRFDEVSSKIIRNYQVDTKLNFIIEFLSNDENKQLLEKIKIGAKEMFAQFATLQQDFLQKIAEKYESEDENDKDQNRRDRESLEKQVKNNVRPTVENVEDIQLSKINFFSMSEIFFEKVFGGKNSIPEELNEKMEKFSAALNLLISVCRMLTFDPVKEKASIDQSENVFIKDQLRKQKQKDEEERIKREAEEAKKREEEERRKYEELSKDPSYIKNLQETNRALEERNNILEKENQQLKEQHEADQQLINNLQEQLDKTQQLEKKIEEQLHDAENKVLIEDAQVHMQSELLDNLHQQINAMSLKNEKKEEFVTALKAAKNDYQNQVSSILALYTNLQSEEEKEEIRKVLDADTFVGIEPHE